MMRGYWDRPAETAEVLRTHVDGRTWLHTGDIGYLDPDGYVVLTDRKKEMLKVSGYQVWPREIEEVIGAHPAVLETGVAGIPPLKRRGNCRSMGGAPERRDGDGQRAQGNL
jgi:long-chain acyl-CoA synthetase